MKQPFNFKAFVFLVLGLLSLEVHAQGKINFSSDEYETNLKTKATHAKGNVKVLLEGRNLNADLIDYFPERNLLNAKGNVILSQGIFNITAGEATVSTDRSTGVFYDAILRSDTGLFVSGSKIESLGNDKFRIVNGKVTLCQDCPQAWSVFGASIELELEGYAEINHALFQIKDQPIAYFPIFYFPVKVKRQSGFLLPRYRFSNEVGSLIGIPYFIDIAPDQDATIEYQLMTEGGHRVSAEHRFRYSARSFSDSKISYNKNFDSPNVGAHRYGLSISERFQITPNWVQRYSGEMASDPRYSASFDEDYRDYRMPALSNRFSLAWQNENSVFWAQGIANRNNLIRDESKNDNLGSIHLLPELYFSYPSFSLLGPIRLGATLARRSFARNGGAVDPVTGWIREGDRSSATVRLFTPYYLFNILLAETKLELRGDYYQFPAPVESSNAYRARIVLEERLNAELSSVYDVDLGDLKAVKHTIEPTITWGYSPTDWRSQHDFFTTESSPRFDIFDPQNEDDLSKLSTSSIERRLSEHHLASWGLGSRLLGRFDNNGRRDYFELLGASITQDYDIKRRLGKSVNISAFGEYNGYRLVTEMAIDPASGNANFRNEFIVKKTILNLRLVQSIRENLKQYGGDLVLKVFKPWTFGISGSYDALGKSFIDEHYNLRYEASEAKCWFFSFDVDRKADPNDVTKITTRYWPRVGFVYKDLGF